MGLKENGQTEREPIREHNAKRIEWWANRQYPMRFQGRFDPEQPMDDNKGGSRVLIKDAMAEVLDDPALSACDSALVYLFERWPALTSEERLACRYTLLNPNNAGGMVELERLEELAEKKLKGAKDAAEIAQFAREAIGKVLNLLCGTGAAEALRRVAGVVIPEDLVEGGAVRLRVVQDVRYRSRREEYEAQVRHTAEDSYRTICRQVEEVLAENPGIGVEDAKKRVKADRDERGFPTSIWKIEEARRFCRAERAAARALKSDPKVFPRYN